MKTRSWWLIFLALAVYAVVLYIVHPNPQATIDVTPGSSVSAEPMGDLAFARLWPRLGLSFQTFAQVPGLLPLDTKSVYVSVEPQSSRYDAADARDLLSFVAKGHEVVWVTSQNDAITKALQVTIAPANHISLPANSANAANGANPVVGASQASKTSKPTTVRKVELVETNSTSRVSARTTLTGLNFPLSAELTGAGLKSAAERVVTTGGTTVGASFVHGKGKIVVWTVPTVFENQGIGTANNLQIPWHFLQKQNILWDEYGHGVVDQGLFQTLFGNGREGTLLLLLAAGVAYLFASNTRFGVIRGAPDERPRVDVELVHALAGHFMRRSLGDTREQLLDAAVRRRLSKMYGVPGTASWDVLDTVVLPGLPRRLGQAYARWRTVDNQDNRTLSRSARKRRLTALQSLMNDLDATGASRSPEADE